MSPGRAGAEETHFVGIGGMGMSGLAELLHARRERVTGCDLREGPTVERLRALGVPVALGHDAAHVAAAARVVVSSAVPRGHPELVEAERRGLPVLPRGALLAELMRERPGVAVCGTHGKTTTTALAAHVLEEAGLDPTALVGGRVIAPGRARSGMRAGGGGPLVAEADESDGSFLWLRPRLAVVTHLEPEHLDHWGSPEALERAFAEFADAVPPEGAAILATDVPALRALRGRLRARTLGYGLGEGADLAATGLAPERGGTRFRVALRGEERAEAWLPLPGRHNVANALAALAVARELGVPLEAASAALARFGGVERRFERRGEAGGVAVVEDYAHHPTEIRAALEAAREAHGGRVVAVFQPHRYTRTRDLFEGFAGAFGGADLVWVTGIYPAGEPKLPGVESAALAEAIRERALAAGERARRREREGGREAAEAPAPVRHVPDLERVVAELTPELRPGDLVLLLGAGDVGGLAPRLLAALGGGAP